MSQKDTLSEYQRKRDFEKSPEPESKTGRGTGDSFVVQMHDATTLHYDFRLELGGVLISWAVTKGPSADPDDKRLAVRTEDHPLDYGGFEGSIPEDQYGGGTVMIWDRGTWSPKGDPEEGLKSGKLEFELDGARMKGLWVLVRMDDADGDRENWLLIKQKDRHAGSDLTGDPSHVKSAASGRTLKAIREAEKDPT